MTVRQLTAAAMVAMIPLAIAAGFLLTGSERETEGGRGETTTKTLRGDSFTTAYPSSWRLTAEQSPTGEGARYRLSSTGAQIDGLGIPPAGTIGVTIVEMPTSALSALHLKGAKPDRAAARQNAIELLPHVIGVPGAAQGVIRVVSPRATSLDGVNAAEEAYTYNLAARELVQMDVLSVRDGRLAFVELDTEPTLTHVGRGALATIIGHWRWH